MAKKKTFATFTPDDILAAWIAALKKGAGPGVTFDDVILDPDGPVIRRLRGKISRRLKEHPFDAAAFRASTRVARDLGVTCRTLVAPRKQVDTAVFLAVQRLTLIHPACRVGGAGPFCD